MGTSKSVTEVRTEKLRSVWNSRVHEWNTTLHAFNAFSQLRERMLTLADPANTDRCLDLGAGTGLLTLPLADRVATVTAVDISEAMLSSLSAAASPHHQATITTKVAAMQELRFPPATFDVVVSNYAMHYLTDEDKLAVLRQIRQWLAPGGRLIIGDMMIGRRLDEHHRHVLKQKAMVMLRRGPAGWWRLLKNAFRITTRKGRLRPCPPDWWTAALADTGFQRVHYEHIVSEAGIVTARIP